jgi:hypothetical protein
VLGAKGLTSTASLGAKGLTYTASPGKDHDSASEIRKAMDAALASLPPQSVADRARSNLEATAVPIAPLAKVIEPAQEPKCDSVTDRVRTDAGAASVVDNFDVLASKFQKDTKKQRKRSSSVDKTSSKSKRRKKPEESNTSDSAELSEKSRPKSKKKKKEKTSSYKHIEVENQAQSSEQAAFGLNELVSNPRRSKRGKADSDHVGVTSSQPLSATSNPVKQLSIADPPSVVPDPLQSVPAVSCALPLATQSSPVPLALSLTSRLFPVNPFASFASPGFGLRKPANQ